MRGARRWVRSHPVFSYLALAFGLSWTGVMMAIAGGSIPAAPQVAKERFVFVYLAMLVGPPVAGILMTALSGRGALRAYRGRLLAWRVPTRWYVVAMLTAPLTVIVADLLTVLAWPDATPALFAPREDRPLLADSRLVFVMMSVGVGLGAGLFEELGWTGFATPTLRARRGVITAGLSLGVMWGAWHFLAVYWGSADAFGTAPVALFMAVSLFSFLPPYRVLMTHVYERTGSLLVGIIMHASLTASMLMLAPKLTGAAAITNNLVFAAVLWIAGSLFRSRPGRAATSKPRRGIESYHGRAPAGRVEVGSA